MQRSVLGLIALVGMLAWAGACGGDDDDDAADDNSSIPANERCTYNGANAVFQCSSRTGCAGTQRCLPEGRFSPCLCVGTSEAGSGASDGGNVSPSDRDSGVAGRGGEAGRGEAGRGEAGSGEAGSGEAGSGEAGSGEAGSGEPEDAGTDPPDPDDEDCDNGEDDDSDGDVDCADDDCEQRVCMAEAPSGWTGPTVLRVGSSVPDDCSGDFDEEVARGGTEVDAGDADCSTCSCTPETPSCAEYLDFITADDAACGGSSCSTQVSPPSGMDCTELSSDCLDGAADAHVEVQLPASASSCEASEQDPEVGDADWALSVLACGASDEWVRGGCDDDELCAPEQPDGTELCIVREGDHDCPGGPYSQKRTYFTGVEDTRGCSECACEQDCSYGWRLYDATDDSCSGPSVRVALDSCVGVEPEGDTIRVGVEIEGTGACEASGGEPTGSVEATGEITACCVP